MHLAGIRSKSDVKDKSRVNIPAQAKGRLERGTLVFASDALVFAANYLAGVAAEEHHQREDDHGDRGEPGNDVEEARIDMASHKFALVD
jgi:hypothetical protein